MENNMKEYSTKDISNIVNIAAPTVRRYAQLLEKSGYRFTRTEGGHRIFQDHDIFIFNEVKNLSMRDGIPTETVIDMVLSKLKEKKEQPIRRISANDIPEENLQNQHELNNIEQYDKRFATIMEALSKLDKINDIEKRLSEQIEFNREQMEFNRLLMQRLDRQDRYIKESLEKRDQVLTEQLRISMKEQQQAIIEAAATEKKWWQRIFGN